MTDVVALGELLIDFTPQGVSPAGMRLFEQNPGGAPANVLCALSNLGHKTAFLGKVGKDMHGDFLCQTLSERGVDIAGLVRADDVFTTLAFVSLSQTGERSFSFARKPGADTCLCPGELNRKLLAGCKIFHFGSLSLTDEPARSATLEALRLAKEAGAVISYDPNYRPPLWQSREAAVQQMRSVLPWVDVMKISDEETTLLTGHDSPEQAAAHLLGQGLSCVVVTLGKDGAYAANKEGCVRREAPSCKVVDTTGAGDSFWGGFLSRLCSSGRHPGQLSPEELGEAVAFANGVATLCVQKRGAIPAMPSLAQVEQLLASIS